MSKQSQKQQPSTAIPTAEDLHFLDHLGSLMATVFMPEFDRLKLMHQQQEHALAHMEQKLQRLPDPQMVEAAAQRLQFSMASVLQPQLSPPDLDSVHHSMTELQRLLSTTRRPSHSAAAVTVIQTEDLPGDEPVSGTSLPPFHHMGSREGDSGRAEATITYSSAAGVITSIPSMNRRPHLKVTADDDAADSNVIG